ncbi:hypothetical protein [Sabulibacter ruber]|uniref:hypothetical protein n=1 Tax=Sabulibacter ruber TaxID=2811901 RepID=UPI001A9749F8|nr:hypothetical protein [Sabulibacter ruber]
MRKYLLGLTVLVALGGTAFTRGETRTARRLVTYQFIGSQLADADEPEFWQEAPSQAPSCPSGVNLPCTVVTDMDIAEWLDGKSDEQVRSQATTKRN